MVANVVKQEVGGREDVAVRREHSELTRPEPSSFSRMNEPVRARFFRTELARVEATGVERDDTTPVPDELHVSRIDLPARVLASAAEPADVEGSIGTRLLRVSIGREIAVPGHDPRPVRRSVELCKYRW